MIESVTVTNFRGETLIIKLSNPTGSGFAVTGITGLGPVKADINTVSYATRNGSLYSSARIDNRNIVFGLVFVPSEGETIENIRQKSYRFFPVMGKVELMFKTDNRNARITGYVEANEPEIFSEREYTQISIICPDPYFYDNSTEQKIGSLEKQGIFSFPFYNRVGEKSLKMGETFKMKLAPFTYAGDAPTGVVVKMTFFGSVSGNLFITNQSTKQTIIFDADQLPPASKLRVGDCVEISTLQGDKYARLYRRNETTPSDILQCVDSYVLDVICGENQFEVTYDDQIAEDCIELSVITTETFEGI